MSDVSDQQDDMIQYFDELSIVDLQDPPDILIAKNYFPNYHTNEYEQQAIEELFYEGSEETEEPEYPEMKVMLGWVEDIQTDDFFRQSETVVDQCVAELPEVYPDIQTGRYSEERIEDLELEKRTVGEFLEEIYDQVSPQDQPVEQLACCENCYDCKCCCQCCCWCSCSNCRFQKVEKAQVQLN